METFYRPPMKILIICTGNTCRSQMAEGFLRSFNSELEVYSAGTMAEGVVNPYAVKAMAELGIDISNQQPESVSQYINQAFDYVITVCDGAHEACPVFTGDVKKRLHIGFDDPADARGTEDEVMPVYRKVRDEIKVEFLKFYKSHLNNE
jgi:arsenate reductase